MKKLLLLTAFLPGCASAQPMTFLGNNGTGPSVYVSAANPLPITSGSTAAPSVIAGTDDGTSTGVVSIPQVVLGKLFTTETSSAGILTAVTASNGLLTSLVTASTDTTPATVNIVQTNGSTVPTGNGTAAGALRVGLPTDWTGAFNLTQVAGASVNTGNGASSGSPRVALPNDWGVMGVYGSGGFPTVGLAVLAEASGNPKQLIVSDASVAIDNSTAATVQAVALVSGKTIVVMGYDVSVGAADTFKWVYGTGTNCGTGTTALTGAYDLVANQGMVVRGGFSPIFTVPASNALCFVKTTTAHAAGVVSYTQQ